MVDSSRRLGATVTGEEVLLTTERNPKFNEHDTKIEAVLIAKTVFDLLPDEVQRSKVMFYNAKDDTIGQIVLNRTELKAYADGKLTEAKLLASIELSNQSTADDKAADVVDGPLKGERLKQLLSIQTLKDKGANVSRVEALFADQEKHAAAGDLPSVKESLKTIGSCLDEQRKSLINAQTAEAALGRSTVHQVKNAPQNSAPGGPGRPGHVNWEPLREARQHLKMMAGIVNASRSLNKPLTFFEPRIKELQERNRSLNALSPAPNELADFEARVNKLFDEFRSQGLVQGQ